MDYIALEYKERLHQVLDESWRIYKAQFMNGKHDIIREAPFQHHFAQIIRSVGELYCISKEDSFKVNLEQKCENIRGKNKFIDISCSYLNQIDCAIELKFKTELQGAQDHGKIDAYLDLEALELATREIYNFGKFYMITNSRSYIKASKKGVGLTFNTSHGYRSVPNSTLISHSKGRENVQVHLKNSYNFDWETIGDWHFLDITVSHETSKSKMHITKESFKRAYEKWTEEEDNRLVKLIKEEVPLSDLVKIFERNEGSIRSRIRKISNKNS